MNTPCVRSFMFVNILLCSLTFIYVRLNFNKYINSYIYINIRFFNCLYKYT
ncbi:hypothetical protein HanRHA438_Chr02g0094891 [Helianthus annuus]|nr:hypothetical protein HanRHA438_Chr02g0094891 [Helianthus annuus]